MTNKIHPSAFIDETAQIAEDVEIEAFTYIGPKVKIGKGSKIRSQARLEHCEIGENCLISSGAIIGSEPQDMGYKGEPTKAIIGNNCQIREHATVNRASGEGNVTKVGNNCMLMTGSHVAHNCELDDNVILANLATLGGHVTVGNGAFIGGMVVIHQNVRIGEMSIMSGFSGSRQDVPPYAKTDGRPARVVGTNVLGLRRNGVSQEDRTAIKNAYKYLWFSELTTAQAIEKIKQEIPSNKNLEHLVNFIETSKRGVAKRRTKKDELND